MRRLRPAIAGESRPRDAGAVGAAIVRRDDLDVLAIPAAIRLLVLDADVREMHLVIEVRQVVFVRPLANLIRGSIGVAVVVVAVLVAFVQPPLVLALELVVQDDAIDAGAALQQPRLCLFVGAIDLDVVLQFARACEARVERLLVLVIAVSVALEQAAAFLRQDHRVIAITGHADGLDQPLLAKMPEVAGPWVGRPVVVVPEITTGDHSKRTDGRQRARLRAA